MLSMTNMNSAEAAHYHQEEQNYYQSETELGQWQGKGAKALSLDEFKFEDFERLCHGINPHTDEVLVDTKKRALTDLTFSAPKSVSVLIELSDNESELSIRQAHDKAVSKTIQFIEENYSQTREQIDGERNVINTNNMVIAKFQHDTSRELDPQLHTHCGVMNMTQKEDGTWRALHNDELFQNKMLFGLIYRNQLSQNLNELGYQTEITNAKQGLFEVKGVSEELIHEFSTRREQVLQKVEELREKYPKMEETKLKEMATLDSRKSKDKTLNRTEIRADNIKRAEVIEDISNIVEDCKAIKSEDIKLTSKEYLERAKELLTDKESVFTKEELLKQSLKLSMGQYSLDHFQSEISNDTELINLESNLYTTQQMIDIERKIIADVKAYKNSYESISNNDISNEFIESHFSSMTKGQKESFSLILNNKDLVTGVQGDAGTGKTFMLKAIEQYMKENDSEYSLQGLSFTGKAADEIQKEANIDSTTLHSFLNQKEFKENQIYVVDEASMIGSKQMSELMKRANETNSRIVLIGDTKQFQTLSAGGIFEQLQKDGLMNIAIMDESMRAKTNTMKSLYKDIKSKDIELAFKTLEDNNMITESINPNDIKSEYLKDRKNTLLIASKNSDRVNLNESIRESIKDELGDSSSFEVRDSRNLNDTEKHFSQYYKEGQLIFIQKGVKGLRAGAEATIESINHDKNTITINSKSKKVEIDLKRDGNKIASFDLNKKKFAIGEQVVFTKNDKKLGLKNGQIATIESINGNAITFKRGDKELKIDSNNYNYFDYGYAITDYKSQGQTSSKVISIADADVANTNSLYVQVTRAKNDVKIFTNDIQKLKENSLNSQVKTSTLNYETKIKEKTMEIEDRKKLNEEKYLNKKVFEEEQQQKEEKSFLSKIKDGDEILAKIGNANEIIDFSKKHENKFSEIEKVIESVDDYDFAKEMVEQHNMKEIKKSTLVDYTNLAKNILHDALNDPSINFEEVLSDVVKHNFSRNISKQIENTL